MGVKSPTFHTTMTEPAPEGWFDGDVAIKISGKPDLTVEAWRRGEFAVHRITGKLSNTEFGSLSHVPTGLRIHLMDSIELAAALGEAIEGFADWSNINSVMSPDTPLAKRVASMADKISAVKP